MYNASLAENNLGHLHFSFARLLNMEHSYGPFPRKKGNVVGAGRNTYFVLIKNRTHSSTRHKVKGIEQIG